jgi:hypothetical protein
MSAQGVFTKAMKELEMSEKKLVSLLELTAGILRTSASGTNLLYCFASLTLHLFFNLHQLNRVVRRRPQLSVRGI